jgi:tetratricopeptide (TPR) repeat protein
MKIQRVLVFLTLYVLLLFGDTDERHIQQQQEVTIKQQKQAVTEFELGNDNYKNKNIPEAIKKFQKAIQINPNISYFYANLGNCLREVGEYDEALIILKKALSLNYDAKNWYNYGVLSHVKGGIYINICTYMCSLIYNEYMYIYVYTLYYKYICI